jgi:hypothetical protein
MIPEVNIPAKFYDAALNWCNERRAEDGISPLTELPAGKTQSPRACPCGEASGWAVWSIDATRCGHGEELSLPDAVAKFVKLFDSSAVEPHELRRPIRTEDAA